MRVQGQTVEAPNHRGIHAVALPLRAVAHCIEEGIALLAEVADVGLPLGINDEIRASREAAASVYHSGLPHSRLSDCILHRVCLSIHVNNVRPPLVVKGYACVDSNAFPCVYGFD